MHAAVLSARLVKDCDARASMLSDGCSRHSCAVSSALSQAHRASSCRPLVQEAMRLKPSVGGTVRVSDREVTLAGRYRIPASTALWTPTYIVHNSRNVWGEDAGEYKPVRATCCMMSVLAVHASSVPLVAADPAQKATTLLSSQERWLEPGAEYAERRSAADAGADAADQQQEGGTSPAAAREPSGSRSYELGINRDFQVRPGCRLPRSS